MRANFHISVLTILLLSTSGLHAQACPANKEPVLHCETRCIERGDENECPDGESTPDLFVVSV